jgi:hypothetical protein
MGAIFFSQRKPRGFNYQPRFYDPDAEAREDRKRVVLGEKYRSPQQLKREQEAIAEGRSVEEVNAEAAANYVPGAYLREHIAARRGSMHAADSMKKRRKKVASVPVLFGILVVILVLVWQFYFK